MNEAENPKNEDLNESVDLGNPPQVEKENCPFYSLFPNENSVVVSNENTVVAKLPPAHSPVSTTVNNEQWEEDKAFPDSTMEIASEEKMSVDSKSNGILELDSAQWESIPDLHISEDKLESNSQQDWVAEPDSQRQADIDEEFQQLLDLNQELRSANDDLYQKVEELTLALTDNQKALQKQKNRSSIAESMLSQQNQENAADREKIQSLFQQLETSIQTIKRQESLIESYKAHLESTQQRLAQLERECTDVQSKYSDQSYQLSQSENACRELRTRLMRQQRQNLQFKAALSKCLDTPVPGALEDDENGNSTDNFTRQSSISSSKLRSFLTNAQPIRPWSAPHTESFNNDDIEHRQVEDLSEPSGQVWQESVNEFSGWDATVKNNIFTEPKSFVDRVSSEAIDKDDAAQVYIWDTTIEENSNFSIPDETNNEVSIWDIEANEEYISPQATTNFTSEILDEGIVDEEIPAEAVSHTQSSDLEASDLEESDLGQFHLEESNLEDKLDSVIEMFFRNQGISYQSSPSVNTDNADTCQTPIWEAVVNSIDTNISDHQNSEDKPDHLSYDSLWCEDNFETSLNSGQFIDNTSNDNSPSPVVYPERSRKLKKSLASVELPDFRSHPKAE